MDTDLQRIVGAIISEVASSVTQLVKNEPNNPGNLEIAQKIAAKRTELRVFLQALIEAKQEQQAFGIISFWFDVYENKRKDSSRNPPGIIRCLYILNWLLNELQHFPDGLFSKRVHFENWQRVLTMSSVVTLLNQSAQHSLKIVELQKRFNI